MRWISILNCLFWVIILVVIVLLSLRHGLPQQKKIVQPTTLKDDLECCYSEQELKELKKYRDEMREN